MTHNCRMGWLPNAQMIADGMPDTPKAKPPALLRRPATEFKGECFDARDMAHPAAKVVRAPATQTITIVVNTAPACEAIRAAIHQVAKLQAEAYERAAQEVPQFDTLQDCLEWARKQFDTSGMSVQGVMGRVTAMRRASQHLPSAAAPKANAEGWIEWGGGECSIEARVNVLVRYRGGEYEDVPRPANAYRWRHGHETDDGCREEYDIVAYRVLP